MCGCSSSPRCVSHCLVTHVARSNREPKLVCVCALTCVFRVRAPRRCMSTACEEPVCVKAGCEMKNYSALKSLLKCHQRGRNANAAQASVSVRACLSYTIMLVFPLTDVTSASD